MRGDHSHQQVEHARPKAVEISMVSLCEKQRRIPLMRRRTGTGISSAHKKERHKKKECTRQIGLDYISDMLLQYTPHRIV